MKPIIFCSIRRTFSSFVPNDLLLADNVLTDICVTRLVVQCVAVRSVRPSISVSNIVYMDSKQIQSDVPYASVEVREEKEKGRWNGCIAAMARIDARLSIADKLNRLSGKVSEARLNGRRVVDSGQVCLSVSIGEVD